MALEIAIRRFGGPEVLEARDVPPQVPGEGQIRIRHKAIGVNFTDVHGRRGDYAPLHALDVIDKIARGDVYRRRLTFREGLTIVEMAQVFESKGFGPAAEFVAAASDPTPIRGLDATARDLEGYLFPDTYTMARQATAAQLHLYRRQVQLVPQPGGGHRHACEAGVTRLQSLHEVPAVRHRIPIPRKPPHPLDRRKIHRTGAEHLVRRVRGVHHPPLRVVANDRRAAQPLEDPVLAQEREVVGERDERRRHHAQPGDPRHDDVEVLLAAGEHRPEQREQEQRQQEVEERRARVAPEHPALQAVLPPGDRDRLAHSEASVATRSR